MKVLEEIVSAADANRRFSELLRSVKSGNQVVVTSHGRPVARIIPISETETTREKARETLLARLNSQEAVSVGKWTRDELYED